MAGIPAQDIQQIITNEDRADLLVKHADALGQALARPLNTSQIRALFGEVRQIQGQMRIDHKKAWRRLHLLKPKMAYRVKRATGTGVRDLVAVLDPAVDEVLKAKDEESQKKYFQRFVEFFEAILAYHKFHGGN
ncbi:MAG: type III-A CRISPR-associated protein Csm2 [Candidatus Methanomethylicaceae archaeon]